MVKDNLFTIRGRIARACKRAGRDPAEVTIVAVSKNRTVEQIKEVIAGGIVDIGENRVQEAAVKLLTPNSLPVRQAGQLPTIKWHLVGHLQTNKVKEALKLFDLIHSVDSLRLAQEIDKQAVKINKVQDILIEVKTSGEATKFGILPQDTAGLIEEAGRLKNINIHGLMTIAPLMDEAEKARPYFRKLRELRDKLQTSNSKLPTLSMGMTGDFEVAIEEGANMLRIGRAIFE